MKLFRVTIRERHHMQRDSELLIGFRNYTTTQFTGSLFSVQIQLEVIIMLN